jgi:aspartyl aminopeptidase
MTHLLEDLSHFLTEAPTSWHATTEMGNRLASLDFSPLDLSEKWKLENGGKYFVIQDGSIAAFVLPEKKPKALSLVAAHTDSPALKLKPHVSSQKANLQMLGVEIYGSPVLSTWLNRDLVITGRVLTKRKKKEMEEHLVFFEEAPVLIPLIAPHLDREIYKNGLQLKKEGHLSPVAAMGEKLDENYLKSLLKRQLSFLVPLEEPRFIGKDAEMLASYRLDNLASAHAGLVALGNIKSPPKEMLSMGVFFDHEEVGSQTRVGAESRFFADIYQRLCAHYKFSPEEESILRHKSLCLSVDLTHAFNPNFESKHDPVERPLLGGGITLKHNANMRYSTNAKTEALLKQACETLSLPCQQFVNRADNPPGSTVGPIFATRFGIETADIGIPQLSMHAAREVISCQDHLDQCALLTHFLQRGLS